MKRKPSLEKGAKCPYLINIYADRISCEAPKATRGRSVMLIFYNAAQLTRYVSDECGSIECKRCPIRKMLDEQYGV